MAFKHHVFGADLIDIFKLVSQARATRGFDAQPHADTLATLGKVALDVAGSGLCQRNGHVSSPALRCAFGGSRSRLL